MNGFWSVDELADGLTDCGEVARGGCLFASNISVKTSTVPTVGKRSARPNMTRPCNSDSTLSHRLKIPPVTNHALCYDRERHAFKNLFTAAAAGTATEFKKLI